MAVKRDGQEAGGSGFGGHATGTLDQYAHEFAAGVHNKANRELYYSVRRL